MWGDGNVMILSKIVGIGKFSQIILVHPGMNDVAIVKRLGRGLGMGNGEWEWK